MTWHRVAYDIAAVQAAIRAAGLPGRLADRLAYGHDRARMRARSVIGGRRPLQGRKPGDKRRPRRATARAVLPLHGQGPADGQGGGQRPDDARARACRTRSAGVVLGRPLASEDEAGERLSKVKALAIFSSDAISSSAYATEEILRAF